MEFGLFESLNGGWRGRGRSGGRSSVLVDIRTSSCGTRLLLFDLGPAASSREREIRESDFVRMLRAICGRQELVKGPCLLQDAAGLTAHTDFLRLIISLE